MSFKLNVVLLLIIAGFTWYVLSSQPTKATYSKALKSFSVPIKVEVAKKSVTVKVNPMVVQKINNRGDLKITPTAGKIVSGVDQYFAKDEEIPITINAEAVIPNRLNKNKFGASYSIYQNKVIPVWMYEGYAISNISFNMGFSNGVLVAIGNALSPSMEDYIGVSFMHGRSPDAQFGFTIRF